jgi:hypothetical protein
MANDSEFIEHLSKEIETHTNAMMTFRTRIGFTVFLGPFVLLGTYMLGTQRAPFVDNLTGGTIGLIILLGICYVLLGLVGAMIELVIWRQCNRWRTAIVALVDREDVDAKIADIQFSQRPLIPGWILAYSLFFASFVVMVLVISRLFGTQ